MIDLTHALLPVARVLGRRRSGRNEIRPGAILGFDEQGVAVVLAPPTTVEAAHALVFASSGAGKTILLASAIVQEWNHVGA